MMSFLNRRIRSAAMALALVGSLAACDNPVEGEHEDHAIGLVVLNAQNQEVVRINIEANPAVTGGFTIPRTGSSTYTVRILMEDGDLEAVDGAEFSVNANVADPQLATVERRGNDQLALSGRQAGSTTVRLALLHGGHEDFFREVPLTVQ